MDVILLNFARVFDYVQQYLLQGSSLGSCLFIVFINNLHKKFKTSKRFLFADDSKMASSAKAMVDCLLTHADLTPSTFGQEKINCLLVCPGALVCATDSITFIISTSLMELGYATGS